ncbi:MAG: acylphosphatase [Phreatobacter sp.]
MARHLSIRGRVQGVGYRQWFRRRAVELGATGWVRNRADGSVEALVIAGDEAYARLVRDAMNGPMGARVDEIRETFVDFFDPEREFTEEFEIRATI